jgi:hypothetical protein
MFDGDDWEVLREAQHDAYRGALRIIRETVAERWLSAEKLLDVQTDIGPSLYGELDHRVLQNSHDLLAALWRVSGKYREPQLPLTPMDDLMTDWVSWLRRHLLTCSPVPIRYLAEAIAFQNSERGYAAEQAAEAWFMRQLDDSLTARIELG